jgi:hypothetical protein
MGNDIGAGFLLRFGNACGSIKEWAMSEAIRMAKIAEAEYARALKKPE